MRNFLTQLVEQAHADLRQSTPAQKYLHMRGVPPYLWGQHDIGFLPLVPPCTEQGLEADRYASWRKHAPNRSIVLPIHNFEGKLAGICVRSIDQKQYDYYILKDEIKPAVFFGLKQSLRTSYEKRWVLAVEGPFDYLSVAQYIPNSLALTTNSMSKGQKRMLRRFVSLVALGLDEDGKKETQEKRDETSQELAAMGLNVVLVSSVYKDWNEYATQDPVGFKEHCATLVVQLDEETSWL